MTTILVKSLVLLLSGALLASNAAAVADTPVGGPVPGGRWTKENSPYVVTNDVYVSGSLTIGEGVEVRFLSNWVFEVAAKLKVLGSAEAPVVFQPADTKVGWQGLLFRDAVPGSFFVHAVIQGSKNSGVRITNTPPAFTNCVIWNNTSPSGGGGINASISGSSDLSIVNCTISSNSAGAFGGGIYGTRTTGTTGQFILDSCNITHNLARNGYGGGVFLAGAGTLSRCLLSENTAPRGPTYDGAGGGVAVVGQFAMKTTEISQNSAYQAGGVYVIPSSVIRMSNCKVLKNQATTAGGGLFLYDALVEAVNCVITGNQPEGIQIWDSIGRLKLTNSIVFFNNNGGSQISGAGSPSAVVAYSDIQDKVWPGSGNISSGPALCPENSSLIWGSPCIDAGHPGLEFRDGCVGGEDCSPYARGSSRNDMGAYGGPGVCNWADPRPEPVIRINPDNVIAAVGREAQMGVIATGDEPLSYQWSREGTALPDQTNSVLKLPGVQLAQTGGFTVMVSNALGSLTSQPVRLMVSRLAVSAAGFSAGKPVLRIANGTKGTKCSVHAIGGLTGGDTYSLPSDWPKVDTITLTGAETLWTDPRPLQPNEPRFYGVVPVE